MMFIVDGTGPKDPAAYQQEMAGGFCKGLEKRCRGQYWRGPTDAGFETTDIAAEVVSAVRAWHGARRPGDKLLMAGHSRGGAAVIFAAQQLQDDGIDVDAMFLYDAVDRTLNRRDAQKIPANVLRCYHALRDTSLAFYYSDGALAARDEVARCIGLPTGRRPSTMEDLLDVAMRPPIKPGPCAHCIRKALDLQAQDEKMKLVMRALTMRTADGWTINFGNCGIEADRPHQLAKQAFLGSHGAIGGAPIVDARAPRLLLDSDRAAMASVDAWMSGHLARHGAFVTT